MKLLHTRVPKRILDPIMERTAQRGLPVELSPLGSGAGDALLAGFSLSVEEAAAAEEAGVRWVQVTTVGLEDVLDTPLAGSSIALTTVGGLATGPIAEFAFARILEHAKDLPRLRRLQGKRSWEMVSLGELRGSTLTVVGLGPVGQRVAEVGKAFGMHLVGVRRRPAAGAGPCDEVVAPDALTEVLPRTDYLVVAAPQTPATVGMVGRVELGAMKPGALLVNVARGPLVDQEALAEAVGAGRVRAALDVFDEEPLPADSPLWDLSGLAVSPHCASITPTLFGELADIVVANLERFLAGEPLENLVDKESGYPVRG